MDTASRRPQLPALSYLDIDKAKSEDDSYAAQGQHRTSAAPSPTFAQPPPHFGHSTPQPTSGWSASKSESSFASDPHRAHSEDNEQARRLSRQSLPSISEALGVDSQAPYASKPAIQPAASSSPAPIYRRPHALEAPQPHNAYGNHPSFPSFRQDSAGPPSYPSMDAPSPVPSSDARPPLHLQTAQPHPRPAHLDKYGTSPMHEQPTGHSASAMGPPNVPYGYATHPPRYAESTSSSNRSSGPIYQPSAQHAAPSMPPSPWKSEKPASRAGHDEYLAHSSTYGQSVKRHLDLYDLEAALNEIASTSGMVMDFSRRYGERMHQTARTPPSLSTLPSLIEVDDMMHKSRLQLDSLNKIREIIIAERAAYDQQLADQRQAAKSFREVPPPPAVDSNLSGDDSKDGFAGSEPKKRRGRAAPPGRCHSCNRAETPEWRRGPDGARTLCNACGLHYAKVTRKLSNANKAAHPGSSNLRSKEA